MDTRQLEKFAQAARRQLHEQVAARLDRVLHTDSAALRAKAKTVQELQARIDDSSREEVVETVAYTWFNRFCALRYMDVNHYTRMGTVSPAPGHTQPEILQEAKQGYLDPDLARGVDAQAVADLLSGRTPSDAPQQEAYRRLLVGVCNAYHAVMPFMFETIDDYTELLMPDDLLSESSILQAVRDALTPEACADVEVIGWLYQFYIAEKKDAVMGRRGKVPSEDIPAVTQLFTPHWIVRYMVENSLGRLWMRNHPDSRLVEHMAYYIAPEEALTDCLRVTSPEEIRVCDPAVGSGHILTYAFDLLYAIYEEEGYNPVDIPRLILEQNLTGIEIDPRAGALAGFALMMKARARDRRFFRREIQPAICILENVVFAPDELEAYMDAVGRDLFTQDVQDWLQQFEQATTFGSLIRPLVTDTAFIRARLEEVGAFQNLFLSHTHDKLRKLLRMTEALCPRYHVVVANPPYMGSRSMNVELKAFAKDHYPDSKGDLFAMFLERGLELVLRQGFDAMITMETWMFLSSYKDLREELLSQATILTMIHMPYLGKGGTSMGISFGTTATVFQDLQCPNYKGQYSYVRYYETDDNGVPYEFPVKNERLTVASTTDFKKIPGVPIAYWISESVRAAFEENDSIYKSSISDGQNITANNARYLRLIWEVDRETIGVEPAKWMFYAKGGPYRKWAGNIEYVIDWSVKARRFYREHSSARIIPEYLWYRPGVTWTLLTSGKPSFRFLPENATFDKTGSSIFFEGLDDLIITLGFLNTNLANCFLEIVNPTLGLQVDTVRKLPLSPERFGDTKVKHLVTQIIDLSQDDWESKETSWNFTNLHLLPRSSRSIVLPRTYTILRDNWRDKIEKMKRLEEENNRIFIKAYGLEDELAPDVPLSEVTLTCNPHYRYGSSGLKSRNWSNLCERFPDTCQRLAQISLDLAPAMPEEERLGLEQRLLEDTMKEFISYAVGCMFGRYSLDKPGLVLANQGETLEDYLRQVPDPSFTPVADNVIPMLDGDWFAGDITARFKRFLRVTFGEAHYAENLAFIELALNRDIQGYFLRNFYDDHVRTYSKRPIYWLFSSPNGSFNALIYMHRYRPDTVSVVLNDYLREFRAKLEARRQHLEHVERSATTPQREKAQAVKALTALAKTLKELRAYEDQVLYPLATQQVAIDLDDGVAVNYKKFGKALAHVRGLSG